MDLLFNEEMVERIYKLKKNMRLHINGGGIVIDHKVVVEGYIKYVWFDKTSITNSFFLKNLIQQYRVTYDIPNQIFIFHHEENNKPNMQFRIHDSGFHYYDPTEDFTFVNHSRRQLEKI